MKDVPHAIKVRVLADMEDRVRLEMEHKNIVADEALRVLTKDDEERRKWSQNLYGINTADPSLYDLVIHIKQLSVDDAVDIISHCSSKEQFQTTPDSQRMIEELALSAELNKALISVGPDIEVCIKNKVAFIETRAPIAVEDKLINEIKEVTGTFEGISEVKIKRHSVVVFVE